MAVPKYYFNFCGELKLPTKNPWIKRETVTLPTSMFDKISLNMGIKSGGNCVFVTSQGTKNKTVRTISTDNKPIEIAWEDRLDPDVIKSVASYRKWTIDLGGEYNEYITAWDFVTALENILPDIKDRVIVRGTFTIRPGKTRNYDTFDVQHISLAKESDKDRFKMNVNLVYRKTDIDKNTLGDGKWLIPCYIEEYVSKDEPDCYLPMDVVFNTKAFNLEDIRHKKQYDVRIACLEPKIKNYVCMPFEINVLTGAEQVDFSVDMLTPLQKLLLDSGEKTLDDFRPKGSIYGASVKEYRLGSPNLRDDYASGPVEIPMTASEFEAKIYQPPQEIVLTDVIEKAKDEDVEEEQDDLDLF